MVDRAVVERPSATSSSRPGGAHGSREKTDPRPGAGRAGVPAVRSIAASASCSSTSPGSPLTPTAPTRTSPSNTATPPRKNVNCGSKLARSTGLSRDLVGQLARRARVRASRRVGLALRVQPRVGRGAVHGRGGDELAVRVGDEDRDRAGRLGDDRVDDGEGACELHARDSLPLRDATRREAHLHHRRRRLHRDDARARAGRREHASIAADNLHRDALTGTLLADHPNFEFHRVDVMDGTALWPSSRRARRTSSTGRDRRRRHRPRKPVGPCASLVGTSTALEAALGTLGALERFIDFSTSEVFGSMPTTSPRATDHARPWARRAGRTR